MGDTSLIRAALLAALIAAFGFVAAGRAPAAEPPAVACAPAPSPSGATAAISSPPPCPGASPFGAPFSTRSAAPAPAVDRRRWLRPPAERPAGGPPRPRPVAANP